MFDKYPTKFIKEKQEIEKQLAANGTQVSNLEKCIDTSMAYASKLNTMWNAAIIIKTKVAIFTLS